MERFELSTAGQTAQLLEGMRSICSKHREEWKDYAVEIDEEAVIIQPRRKIIHFPFPVFSADLCAEIEKTDGHLIKLVADTNIGPQPKQFVWTMTAIALAFQIFWLALSAPHNTGEWIGYAIVNVSTLAFCLVTARLSYRQAKTDELKMIEIMRQLHSEL